MKKLVLLFLLCISTSVAFAQKDYTYLKGQDSPFNGEFREPRYHNVDSIGYILYVDDEMTGYDARTISSFPEIPGFAAYESYMLVKRSLDNLTDTIKHYTQESGEKNMYEYVKKYSDDGKLIYSSSVLRTPDGMQKFYTYDDKERISEIVTIKNNNGDATVIVNDTVKYDYNFKQYSNTLEYNTIYQGEDSIMVFYFDEGYELHMNKTLADTVPSLNIIWRYEFDTQNRLVKYTTSYSITEPTTNETSDFKEPEIIEYKYTANGYEKYENDVKRKEYKFQKDGYCTEIITYLRKIDENNLQRLIPGVIERYSYFKNGEPAVANELIENNAPKAYGVQGGLMIETQTPVEAGIYLFSGAFVKKIKTGTGQHMITLPKGFYIVAVGDLSYKVMVK